MLTIIRWFNLLFLFDIEFRIYDFEEELIIIFNEMR